MKALILVAGLGTRLAPITDKYPKCMTEVVDGISIIHKQVENLKENGINDIAVVTGYKHDVLKEYLCSRFSGIHFIHSPNYNTTNNMYSAYIGKDFIGDDEFIMMNADVYFDSCILKRLIEFEEPDAIVVDIGTYREESMKVVEANGKLVQISKNIPPTQSLGCSIDIYKFSRQGGSAFFNKCAEYIDTRKELKLWSEVAINDIFSIIEVKACALNGRWFEIDTYQDLLDARVLFSKP